MMIIHNVFNMKNVNLIPTIVIGIASVNVVMKLEKNTIHPKKRNVIVVITVISHPMMTVNNSIPNQIMKTIKSKEYTNHHQMMTK